MGRLLCRTLVSGNDCERVGYSIIKSAYHEIKLVHESYNAISSFNGRLYEVLCR